jgi:hypothetical protein
MAGSLAGRMPLEERIGTWGGGEEKGGEEKGGEEKGCF